MLEAEPKKRNGFASLESYTLYIVFATHEGASLSHNEYIVF